MKLKEIKKLGLCNRDGQIMAAKDENGVCYLIVEADTFHNVEYFQGLGSTEHIVISELSYSGFLRA